MRESGLASKSWKEKDRIAAASSDAPAPSTNPVATIPGSATISVVVNDSSRASSPSLANDPSPNTTRVRS